MTLVWRPGFSGLTDADAIAYVSAVETADGQPLEFGVAKAINDFVVGCKLDGTWSAIKASCILAGARTLNGALIPLAGTAPTNFNFVTGDYNRKTGLVGDGSTKYLNSNRGNSAEPQNSRHLSFYASTLTTINSLYMSTVSVNVSGDSYIYQNSDNSINTIKLSSIGTPSLPSGAKYAVGFSGANRLASTEITVRRSGVNVGVSASSVVPLNEDIRVFGIPTFFVNARLAFYSIGESLDLALLDARVTALITAIGAAIP
jgi:hypothetical protein